MADRTYLPPTRRRTHPTVAEVRRLFSYDPTTGIVTRRVTTSSNAKAGDRAGSVDAKGYRLISINRVQWKEHHLVWLLHYGEWPTEWIDHINRIPSDNRIANLRLVTASENRLNCGVVRGASQYLGVHFDKKSQRWRASIRVNGVTTWLGSFDCEKSAALAYDAAARVAFKEFATPNFPDERASETGG